MRKIYIAITCLLVGAAFANAQTTINTFNKIVHTGANTIEETFAFPPDNSGFSQILMNFALTCPPGGCDPWDRFARINVKKDGELFEIGRYITPYGNGNCSWTLDVSEYRGLLTDSVTLVSHIETWSNGWELTVDFDFINGTPDFEFVEVKNLWVDYQFTYGDTLFYSIDLPAKTVNIPGNAEKVVFRIVNTGHGQGNYQNAAEFAPKDHWVHVNNFPTYQQNLWKNDCAQNPCSPQGGNWQPGRAGWCPGQEVVPEDVDITAGAKAGQPVELDYVLEPYFNRCSPWNPDCNVNTDCMSWVAACTYDNNGHTEPHYKISVQLLMMSSTPISVEPEISLDDRVTVYPNPSGGMVNVDFEMEKPEPLVMELFDMNGRKLSRHSLGTVSKTTHALDLTAAEAGIYFLKVTSPTGSALKKVLLTK